MLHIFQPFSNTILIKLDSTGNTKWINNFIEGGNNVGYFVKEASDKGFIIGGLRRDNLLKTDSMGNLEWKLSFNLSFDKYTDIYAVCEEKDNSYFIAGRLVISLPAPPHFNYERYAYLAKIIVKNKSSADNSWKMYE